MANVSSGIPLILDVKVLHTCLYQCLQNFFVHMCAFPNKQAQNCLMEHQKDNLDGKEIKTCIKV